VLLAGPEGNEFDLEVSVGELDASYRGQAFTGCSRGKRNATADDRAGIVVEQDEMNSTSLARPGCLISRP
jgi:hypothetical protein